MRFNGGGARLAALQLSQLSWLDRRWVLNRLAPEQRTHVKAALTELSKLNIANKAELLQQLLHSEDELKPGNDSPLIQQAKMLLDDKTASITVASRALLSNCLQGTARETP